MSSADIHFTNSGTVAFDIRLRLVFESIGRVNETEGHRYRLGRDRDCKTPSSPGAGKVMRGV